MLIFKRGYFILTLLLLSIEILIALYMHDAIIRPYIGDLLVVILIYCFLRSFLNIPALKTAIGVLIFSYFIETLQYFRIVELLGLGKYKLARIIIGTSFQWIDILAYTIGIIIVLSIEYIFNRSK